MNRLAVLLVAALGGLLVVRTGLVYRGTDPVALAVVVLIGFGLLVGVAELWLRLLRADRARREVTALPAPATVEAVNAASPGVRGWLRAAMAGRSAPPSKPGFTPYLVGLLVMVGMLGTFLGLVDTMAGAQAVVGNSTDIDTLRAGLAGPFAGLTRAFGTSVAGVAGSATLGLAALFVRRSEAGVRVLLVDYATGALAHLTPAGRQTATLELLSGLAERSAEGAAAAAGQALTTHLAAVHAALEAASEREATRTDTLLARVDQLLDAEMVRREAQRDMAVSTRDAIVGMAEAEGERTTAVATRIEESVGQMLTALADHGQRERADLEELTGLMGRLAVEADERDAAQATRSTALAERLSSLAERSAEGAATAAGEALHTHLGEVQAALQSASQSETGRTDALLARVDQLLEAETSRREAQRAEADALLDALAAREAERTETLVTAIDCAHAQRTRAAREALEDVRSRLADQATTLHDQVAETRDAVVRLAEAEGERTDAVAGRIEASVGRVVEAVAAQGQRERADLEQLTTLMGRLSVEAAERETAQASRAEVLADQLEQAVRKQTERLAAFEEQLDGVRTRSAEALAERLSTHAEGLAEKLASTTGVVSEASDLLRAGGAELSAVAEMFTDAVDGYRESNERWLSALGHLETTLDASGDGAAGAIVGEYLDQTREVFGDAMRFQRELFTELRAMRGSGPS